MDAATNAINNLTVNGQLTSNADPVTGTGTFTVSGTGTLLVGGAFPASGFGTPVLNAGSTVNYNGTGPLAVAVQSYSNLTLSGSGSKDMTGVTTVGGNLSTSGSATATLPSTLATIGGNVSLTGTSALSTGSLLNISGALNIGDGTTFTAGAFALTVGGTTTVGGGSSGTTCHLIGNGDQVLHRGSHR